MPLIVMCGYPCSGKTRRAEELKVYFEQNTKRKVDVVGDGALDVEKNSVYAGRLSCMSSPRSLVISRGRNVMNDSRLKKITCVSRGVLAEFI